ncbi:Palmitoyl-acyl carrier protein thioesterase, chloroplastic [Dichanthelium oligosanthes]|uniref:Acyl-[acyl-carrier-protein] hydrolase n=1 Tax=Dichanthelium oligosanthes TaxID=888268 RepID=A0A1E5WCW7_9POAL|nr:Palmitoyl-acyl carrier protein thioesterase, chloroplastic [Dichanthelium oligosanthes]
MASASSCTIHCSRVFMIRCSASEGCGGQGQHRSSNNAVRVNGAAHRVPLQVGAALETSINRSLAELSAPVLTPLPTAGADDRVDAGGGEERIRQNIPTEKQTVDPFRQALIVGGGVRYQQTLVVRSYEVGPDKTATMETVLNLLQETALNHVWMSGLLGDGFGATHGMIKNNLIWVVSRMHVQVDQYPICTWVMMNKVTRRLSKMPEEVRGEIAPWFIDRHAIEEEAMEKIIKLDSNAKYVDSDLKPKRSDLDMNHHVNNVKYVRWMLETLPDHFLQQHQLSSIILEYRKECGSSDVVQSICQPDEYSVPPGENINMVIGPSLLPEIISGRHSLAGALQQWPTKYTHLLQLKAGDKHEEIVRGRTTWKKKNHIKN